MRIISNKIMLVKICGIKTAGAAKAATKYGADFLGFNFVPTSKRLVAPSAAQKIIKALPENNRPVCAGVFMNQSAGDVQSISSLVQLDMLQFHGKESPKFCASFKLPYIKAFTIGKRQAVSSVAKKMQKYKAEYFLLDRKKRGEGRIIDLQKVSRLANKFPVILSGGLTPENIKSAIAKAGKIKGVDVAGGVEKNGKKNLHQIKNFINKAKFALIDKK